MSKRALKIASTYLREKNSQTETTETEPMTDAEIREVFDSALRNSYMTIVEDWVERQKVSDIISMSFVLTRKFNPNENMVGALSEELKRYKTPFIRDLKKIALSKSGLPNYLYDIVRKENLSDEESIEDMVRQYMYEMVRDTKREYRKINDILDG